MKILSAAYNDAAGPGKAGSSLTEGLNFLEVLNLYGSGTAGAWEYGYNAGAKATDDDRNDAKKVSLMNLQGRLTDKTHTVTAGDVFESFSQYSLATSLKGASYRFRKEGAKLPEVTGAFGWAYPRWDSAWRDPATRSLTRRGAGRRSAAAARQARRKRGREAQAHTGSAGPLHKIPGREAGSPPRRPPARTPFTRSSGLSPPGTPPRPRNSNPRRRGETKRVQAALDDFDKKSGAISDLQRRFALQFGHDGKRETAPLAQLAAAAKRDFSAAHKADMENLLKPLSDWSPRLEELSGLDSFLPRALENLSGIIFAADGARRYLKDAGKRMLEAADAGLSALKANYAGDMSRLKSASDEEYGREMERPAAPYNAAMEKLKTIEEEARSTLLFDPGGDLKPVKLSVTNTPNGPMVQGNEPPLFRTGFFPASVSARTAHFEKVTADFWNSGPGKELADARRGNEVRQAQDSLDPGAAAGRKLYEDFARAYSSQPPHRLRRLLGSKIAGETSVFQAEATRQRGTFH